VPYQNKCGVCVKVMQQDIIIYACTYMHYTCKYGYERERKRDSDRVLWYICNIRSNLVGDFVITTAIIIITIIMRLPRLLVYVIYVLGGYTYTHHDEHYNITIHNSNNVVYIMCDSVMSIRRNRKQY